MADTKTISFPNTPVLSKIKVGDSVKYLKDGDARAILSAINADVYTKLQLALGDFATEGSTGLVTADTVKAYVDAQMEIGFDVVVLDAVPAATEENYNTYKNNIILVKNTEAEAGDYLEYVIVKLVVGETTTYKVEQIGSTKTNLADYLTKNATVAGVAFGDDKAITAAELEAEGALNLKALSHKDSASGTVSTVDSAKFSYTPEGTVAVTVGSTVTNVNVELASGKYTPAGSITGSAISGGSIEVTVKDAATATAAELTKGDYTPAGSVTLAAKDGTAAKTVVTGLKDTETKVATFTEGTFTANVPTTINVSAFNGGSAATFTQGTKASLTDQTKSSFVTSAINARMATAEDKQTTGVDDETLVFFTAATSDAVTDRGTFTANGDDTFTANTVASLGDDFYHEGSAASKAADTFIATYVKDVNTTTVVDAADISATFAGTTATNALVTGVNYVKQEINTATFTGTTATLGFTGTEADVVTGVTKATVTVPTVAEAATFTGTAVTDKEVTLTKTDKTVTVQ